MSDYTVDLQVDFIKERPILFKAEMVRAILDGRKTQTRRLLKVQPLDVLPMNIPDAWVTLDTRDPEPHGRHIKCRLGKVGDRLWVKETHCFVADGLLGVMPGVVYAADETKAFNRLESLPDGVTVYNYDKPEIWHWRPSIFTHRWASRITLEITGVRCERLQDITEADAIAEGTEPSIVGQDLDYLRYRAGYQTLWERINGAGSWDANPFCWVIEFKVLSTAQAEPAKDETR